jgi:bifunctional non-homologous end joining protein LigD
MLAVAADTLPRDDANWAYEMKWDGMRALAAVGDGGLRLTSRTGNDVTARYPELAELPAALADLDAVLDGEIVALDETGRPSFEQLQARMNVASGAAVQKLMVERPVVYMVFDVLWLAGHSTCEAPYPERRALLERLDLAGPHWQVPPSVSGGGATVLTTSIELGLEGVVAKRLDSLYLRGRRSDAWRKVKPHRAQEFVVGGALAGSGRLSGRLGSLLVGYHDDAGALQFAGRVGSGIDESARTRLEQLTRTRRRDTSPFATEPKLPLPTWLEPDLVVEVAFHEWTRTGRLRAPRYRGLRDDKPAAEVVREAG